MTTYTELQVTSHFSFLRGVSSAEELFSAAAMLATCSPDSLACPELVVVRLAEMVMVLRY